MCGVYLEKSIWNNSAKIIARIQLYQNSVSLINSVSQNPTSHNLVCQIPVYRYPISENPAYQNHVLQNIVLNKKKNEEYAYCTKCLQYIIVNCALEPKIIWIVLWF